ncbi:hypothetical protein Glove_801g12 [Diversispora epigaea]|uniref:Mediator of RNA polymerase II transcription subunit 4 n=1 Tax=Diversispora epigaea TaxID=1348612 RepID=A0A397G241_9GLOM|nr:hypothetical protein Glove_801g12 [Diversispora epigaea]
MVYEIPSDKNTPKSIILENISILKEYQKLIDRFFSAISANAEGKSLDRSPVDIMKDIVELDKKMQQGLDQIEEHQRIHHKILQVENEINAENNVIVDFVNYLRKGKEQIDDFLESSRDTMRAIELASQSNVTADEILKYANRISKYTAAPPGYDLTRPTELQVEPPHPIEAIMRKGLLFRQEYLGMNFGALQNDEEEEEEDEEEEDEFTTTFNSNNNNNNSNNNNNNNEDNHHNKFNSEDAMLPQTQEFNLDLNPELE